MSYFMLIFGKDESIDYHDLTKTENVEDSMMREILIASNAEKCKMLKE